MDFPGINDLIKKYQARAASEGVDRACHHMAPFGYAYLEVLGQAIQATKSLDDASSQDHVQDRAGDIKFGKDGEWAQSRALDIQFRDIKDDAGAVAPPRPRSFSRRTSTSRVT